MTSPTIVATCSSQGSTKLDRPEEQKIKKGESEAQLL